MQEIRIKISGDPKDLQPVIDQLEKVGHVDAKNAKQFKESHDTFKKQTHEKADVFDRFSHGVERRIERMGELLVAAFATEKILEWGAESIKAAEEAEKAFNQLKFAVTGVLKESSGAFGKLIEQSETLSQKLNVLFSPRQIQVVQAQLARAKVSTEQIMQAIPRIADISAKSGQSIDSVTEKFITALNGRGGALKDFGAKFKSTGDKVKDFGIIMDKTKGFIGGAADAMDDYSSMSQEAANKTELLEEKIGRRLAPIWEDLKLRILETINYYSSAQTLLEQDEAKVKAHISNTEAALDKMDKKQLERQKQYRSSLLNGALSMNERVDVVAEIKLIDDLIAKRDEEAKAKIESDKKVNESGRDISKFSKRDLEIRLEELKAEGDEEIKYTAQKLGDLSTLNDVGRAKEISETEKALKKLEELDKKRLEDIEKLYKQVIAESDKFAKEQGKIEADANKALIDESNKAAKLDAENDVRANKEILDERKRADKDVFDATHTDLEIKLKDLKEAEAKELDNITLTEEEKLKIQKDYAKQAADLNKEKFTKDIEDIKQFASAAFDLYQQVGDFQLKSLDYQMEITNAAIQQQTVLAAAGKANTLAFQQGQQNEIEKERLATQKKLQRAKELETFLNLVAGFSKDDPKGAVYKAIASMAVVKGVEASFAEDGGIVGQIKDRSMVTVMGMSKSHRSGKDILLHAEKGEGILSRKEMSALGGAPGFMSLKRQLAGNEIPIPEDRVHRYGFDVGKVVKELQDVKKTIADQKQVTDVHFERMFMFITTKENGVITETQYVPTKKVYGG